jgi:hypothetical protein
MGVMTEDRFERWLRDAVRDYHQPAATPREELWGRIVAARAARRQRIGMRPVLRWGMGIAAVLALGVGIGRWSATRRGSRALTPATVATDQSSALAYRVAAAQYLTRTEALLTGFRTETRAGEPARFSAQARDLLATTRLMLDSPAARDVRLKGLLEDLELVLAQIAQVPAGGDPEDVRLIDQGLEQRSVLLRLRTANTPSPRLARAQGAL